MSKRRTPEGYVLQAVMDYLAARRVYCIRMNSGMLRNPAGRPVAFGEPGMADLLAFPKVSAWAYALGQQLIYEPNRMPEVANACIQIDSTVPLWIECKAPKGKQSELQKSFQAKVESEGHRYAVVHSIEDVQVALGIQ